jgi:hypothetical protein
MGAFIDFAEKRFAELGLETKLSEDRKFIVFRQQAEGGNLLVILHEDNNLLIASFYPGFRVPDDRLAAVYEFVCAINNRMRFGAVEVARDNQELSFKISNLLYSSAFTEDLLRKIMATGVQTTAMVMKPIAAIVGEGISCDEALQRLG